VNKKSKKTLKNAFNIPEPNRKEQFFNSIEIRQQKKLPAHIPMYISSVAAVVLVIGVWSGVKNLPYFDSPEITDKSVYSEQSSETNSYTEDNDIQTTTVVSVAEKNTSSAVRTSVASTATESIAEHSGTATTATEKQNVTESENNSVSENTTAFQTTDSLHETTENRHTTAESIPSSRTTVKTATTNTTRRTTATTRTTEDEVNLATTEPITPSVQATTTQDYENISPTTEPSASSQDEPPVTTDSSSSGAVPQPIETDFTVKPPVRYYPDDNVVDLTDFMDNNSAPPTLDGCQTSFAGSWEDLVENSDMIVIATVDEVIYTGIDGKPYTQENITVSEVIHGYIPENTKISVYSRGGYIPASEYFPDKYIDLEPFIEENAILFDPAQNKTVSQKGDTYLYCIKKSSSLLPQGSYSLITLSDISKFRYEDGYYINMNNNKFMFTIEEVYDLINN